MASQLENLTIWMFRSDIFKINFFLIIIIPSAQEAIVFPPLKASSAIVLDTVGFQVRHVRAGQSENAPKGNKY